MSECAGAKPRIRIRQDPYVLRIKLRAGRVRQFTPCFAAVVMPYEWWEIRPRWKALLPDDPRAAHAVGMDDKSAVARPDPHVRRARKRQGARSRASS